LSSVTGWEAGIVPAVVIVSLCGPDATFVQAASEYHTYVTLPPAVDSFSPASVAWSVTSVPEGTVIFVPVWSAPESEVEVVVAYGRLSFQIPRP
jgi:hypothetical protein